MSHDEKDPEFIARVQVQKFFFQQIGEEETAKFTVHLLDSVDGLNANNRAFAEAYRKILDQGGADVELPVLIQGRDWMSLKYIKDADNNLPVEGTLVAILVKTSASKEVEYFFARYAGEGQFRIETQAELQNDGTRRKLTSTCHASFVTHWQYVVFPENK
jgi:hypothetical protein